MRPTFRYPPPPPPMDTEMLKACPFCARRPTVTDMFVRCVYHTVWMTPGDWNTRPQTPPTFRPGVQLLTPPEEER